VLELKPGHPIGHYYSPINNVLKLDRAKIEARRENTSVGDLKGIEIDGESIEALWNEFLLAANEFPFSKDAAAGKRYYYNNPFYGIGDAFFHFFMIKKLRPKKFIEIGSGFSSACFLDTNDKLSLHATCTFIEPFPSRLRSLLTEADARLHNIIEQPVQETQLSIYQQLQANDVLFIDSTHVMKTDSDVVFELFNILPSLNSGVVIHFHDMFWPFEYPAGWIFDKQYSWNELYAVRAFLLFNQSFEIIFFNDYIRARHESDFDGFRLPEMLRVLKRNCGGGLWLRRK
jgi:hypothetical protein